MMKNIIKKKKCNFWNKLPVEHENCHNKRQKEGYSDYYWKWLQMTRLKAFLNQILQNDIILKNMIKKKLETVNRQWMTIERNYEEKKKWNFLKTVTNRIWELPWKEAERRLFLLQLTMLMAPAKQSQQHEGWWHHLSQNHIIPNQAGSYPAKRRRNIQY